MFRFVAAGLLWAAVSVAHAEALQTLRDFMKNVQTGQAQFTQTVTSPDGKKTKVSTGDFEFSRPDRFRFTYRKPFEQVIVADGKKVWIFDPELNQASSRKLTSVLGATPAALLAGGALEADFTLANQPDKDGLQWVAATPRVTEGAFKSVHVGFRGAQLAALEIMDAFGQRSVLKFGQFIANPNLPVSTFQFFVPAGADVIEQ